ncbi:acetyltransferase (GNAT) family protein [Clostridium homopropionicum DSM 5847]|uniref:Acetyltransferase (GNAT) family protein n=1 Tax=Clostridium homopropionicum DSM 5847 TaxID=1121318 RepID=A0A0L6Z888_9CLOT|nr:GNAT family N-acetyltransferase [Clostridium homopropionicum]KOA19174.1 acetyltransferase (GNAT) family protein [Clostridium homopropionicum DSM 5847]SFG16462.1 Ribosomal protein S18 acetylase RimI [Clostridium homopropionicum]
MIEKLNLKNLETAKHVLELQIASYKIEAEIIGFYEIPTLKDTIESLMECDEVFYGCYKDNVLAGVISYKISENVVDIHRVAVHPLFFKMGIADKLINFVEGLERNINKIVVCTGKKNMPAIGLYNKNGYKEKNDIEVSKDIYITEFEKVIYEE